MDSRKTSESKEVITMKKIKVKRGEYKIAVNDIETYTAFRHAKNDWRLLNPNGHICEYGDTLKEVIWKLKEREGMM